MPEVKRHLYKGEEYKLFVENSEEWKAALNEGWTRSKVEQNVQGNDDWQDDDDTPTMAAMPYRKYSKSALIEVVGEYDNGDKLVQNEGDDSDQWRIPAGTFGKTYAEVKTEDQPLQETPEMLPAKEEEGEIEITVKDDTAEEAEEIIDLNSLELEEIRAIAKEEGIRSWHQLGREKLIKALMEKSE